MMCNHMGGHLVRIESSDENEFVADIAKKFRSNVFKFSIIVKFRWFM